MESTLPHPNEQNPIVADSGIRTAALAAGHSSSRALTIAYWIVTGLLCMEISFTAYWEVMQQPAAAQAFTRLGFANPWFRVELSCAKLAAVVALLFPMIPARLKEWAYAGLAINLISAFIAHLSIADRPASLVPSSTTSVLWALSYFFWRRLQSRQAGA